MNTSFVHSALKYASNIPNWYVLNFGPWFTRQPIVRKINSRLVYLDYFHAAHFVAFHRRAIPSTLKDYAKIINSGKCVPFDDWFGKYGKRMYYFSQTLLNSSTFSFVREHASEP